MLGFLCLFFHIVDLLLCTCSSYIECMRFALAGSDYRGGSWRIDGVYEIGFEVADENPCREDYLWYTVM